MPNIRTVNLVWERRFRGAYPTSPYALDDNGVLTVGMPRPLEARAYDLSRIDLEGAATPIAMFSVETLLRLDVSPNSNDCVGLTSDDVYLFQSGKKSRFLAERHVNYVDVAMSADGRRLAAAFSDLSGVNFASALGEVNGTVTWFQECALHLSAIAISPNGGNVALGSDAGTVWLIDSGRRQQWEFTLDQPVSALACSDQGAVTLYGTRGGLIGLIDGDGKRRWETRLPGEALKLAMSADDERLVALCRGANCEPTEAGVEQYSILCFDRAGNVAWDYPTERRILGVSLSPNGRFLATGARDGTLTVYEIIPGDGSAATAAGAPEALAALDSHISSSDFRSALEGIRQLFDDHPTDIELAETLLVRRQTCFVAGLALASESMGREDYVAAIRTLATLLGDEPLHTTVAEQLRAARELRSSQLIAEGQALAETSNAASAEAILREAVSVSPLDNLQARRILSEYRAKAAIEADAEAERLLASGAIEEAIAAMERAQAISENSHRQEKLRVAQVEMEFTAGMAAYNDKRYSEAVFQFKLVLARDPKHPEAQRYLNFSQKFEQDAANDALVDRFSRLE